MQYPAENIIKIAENSMDDDSRGKQKSGASLLLWEKSFVDQNFAERGLTSHANGVLLYLNTENCFLFRLGGKDNASCSKEYERRPRSVP